MELLSNDSILGICFFIAGMIMLNTCSFLDHNNHYKVRTLRRLEWDGRRGTDALATLPLNILGSIMTYAGGFLSAYGLFRVFVSVF